VQVCARFLFLKKANPKDQTVKIWDAEKGTSTQSWRMGEEGVVSVPDHQVGVVWTPRADNLIISLSLSGNLNYLGEGDSKPRQILHGHQKNITAFASTPSSTTLWTGDSSGRICSWDTGKGISSSIDGETHQNYVSGLSASPKYVSSIGWDDTLRTVDISALTFTGSKSSTEGQPRGIAHSGSHTIVATHQAIQVFDSSSGKAASALPTKFSSLCIATFESTIAAGGDDGSVHIYSLSSGTLKQSTSISTQGPMPSTLSFSPDGSLLAVGHANGKITVYQTSDWSVSISRWSAHTGKVMSIAWRKDGKFAASGALDTSVFVWSIAKPGKRITVANSHKEGVNGVAWEGDDKVISAGMDAAVKVWKVDGLE
jgi:WD repeat-containing protein 1 (actin-interacting protein 1)